jgi:hypothetical protein
MTPKCRQEEIVSKTQSRRLHADLEEFAFTAHLEFPSNRASSLLDGPLSNSADKTARTPWCRQHMYACPLQCDPHGSLAC